MVLPVSISIKLVDSHWTRVTFVGCSSSATSIPSPLKLTDQDQARVLRMQHFPFPSLETDCPCLRARMYRQASDRFGVADACVAPIVNRSVTLGFGPSAGTPLADWLDRAKQRPSVSQTFEEYEKGLAFFGPLAKAVASGERRREYRSSRLEWMIKAGGISIVEEGLEKDNIRFTWPDNK